MSSSGVFYVLDGQRSPMGRLRVTTEFITENFWVSHITTLITRFRELMICSRLQQHSYWLYRNYVILTYFEGYWSHASHIYYVKSIAVKPNYIYVFHKVIAIHHGRSNRTSWHLECMNPPDWKLLTVLQTKLRRDSYKQSKQIRSAHQSVIFYRLKTL